jgi:hypothetical protein
MNGGGVNESGLAHDASPASEGTLREAALASRWGSGGIVAGPGAADRFVDDPLGHFR